MVQEKEIMEGSIVKIKGTLFDCQCGVVISINSTEEPEDGPYAVFFDREVADYLFSNYPQAVSWNKGVPTKENYRECPRVVHFEQADLILLTKWPHETIAKRFFRAIHHSITIPTIEMSENTRCMIKDCTRTANNTTYRNYWGTVEVIYTCDEHHAEFHGKCAG